MPGQSLTAWRFLNTSFGNAFFNMAADEQLVRSVVENDAGPTFRVYGWAPPAVSFGYAQKIRREIDLDEATRRGIDIVRRPTGGRAVLHWKELTYSVICPADHPIIGGNISTVYRAISNCLVAGLKYMKIDAQLEPGRSPVHPPRGKNLTSPCFSSTSQYEITLRGRKLIGSAQKRIGSMVLQHGSLLMGTEHKQVVDLMPDTHERLKAAYADQMEAHTISLAEAGHGNLTFEELADGLKHGFEDVLDTQLVDKPLTELENQGIDELVRTKYGTADWNHRDRSAEVTRRILS